MGEFFRLIYNGIVDIFIRKVEDSSHCYHHLKDSTPYSFYDCQFNCTGTCFSEQGPDSLVCIKPFDNGKQVVLYGDKRSACYLGRIMSVHANQLSARI